MDIFWQSEKQCSGDDFVEPGSKDTKDTQVQFVISLALGLSAFLAFCIVRPRWKTLYAARKRRLDPAVGLPVLPDTFFGWIPALYRVTDGQVLASAGLDAFVFLSFFKLAIRTFGCMFIFAAAILEPINQHFVPGLRPPNNGTNSTSLYPYAYFDDRGDGGDGGDDNSWNKDMGFLWAYLVFTYFFSFVTLYFMNRETIKVIGVRQDYLGTQSTITDRTFRLSGIPKELRSEEEIKELVEKLEIGQVECVTLCRKWEELDKLIADRKVVLQKLEETWSVYLSQKPRPRLGRRNNVAAAPPPSGRGEAEDDENAAENGRLLNQPEGAAGPPHFEERPRPTTRIWYGFLSLQHRHTDALDYYEEKLRQLDEKIRAARKKDYEAADLAFVTMDSIAACQMAMQAVIDPRPGRLITHPAPAPSDIIWSNTYQPRWNRKLRSWTVTLFFFGLTMVWLIPVAFLASLLSLCTIRKAFPELATSLSRHEITKALVQTGLPTAVASLLNVAVPYLYYYLTMQQGMLAQDHVELAAISKNFFFLFFNFFVVFTVFGTASKAIPVLRDALRDTTYLARTLATSIQNLSFFYLNFVMLQGLGLFPLRLLEFGAVAMWPVMRMGAKTPRDYAEMVAPPIFTYGFYLPSALLVFILCLVYSAQPGGSFVLGLGIVYFSLGYFTYKYQLLYAMDQPQHATGGAWPMICYRIILGVVVFQLTMLGVLALNSAFTEAVLVVPVLVGTGWYSYYFRRKFEPLMTFISLRSIKRQATGGSYVDEHAVADGSGHGGSRSPVPRGDGREQSPLDRERELLRRGSTIDEDREKGLKFVNPSFILPLEQPWIYKEPPPIVSEGSEEDAAIRDLAYSGAGQGSGVAHGASDGTPARRPVDANASNDSLSAPNVWRDATSS